MTTFTIDSDNNIIALGDAQAASTDAHKFGSAKELGKLTADWSASRLADTWNIFAGAAPFDELKPVKKFTDRKVAVTRIWQAIQRLATTTSAQAADVAPEASKAGKASTKKTKRTQAAKTEEAPKRSQKEVEVTSTREGSKKAIVLGLLRQPNGATLTEIMKATDWQKHSVRGFISGALGKKMGLIVESTKNETGERSYRLAK